MLTAKFFIASCLCGGILALTSSAQPTRVLEVDVENFVAYGYDVNDLSAIAKTPGPVPSSGTTPLNFGNWVSLADITAVGGSPAKGIMVIRTQTLKLTPTPSPGQAIADLVRGGWAEFAFEFLQPDGTPIGSVFAIGLSGGVPPPGSASGSSAGNNTIVGGTGAFIGARGTVNLAQGSFRVASQTEDPSMRRINGGNTAKFLLQIMPIIPPSTLLR